VKGAGESGATKQGQRQQFITAKLTFVNLSPHAP
jgi:hypothetical protein